MDYEKKYKEAIERAKEIIECSKSDTKEVRMVLSFFPELADSKDERIRKDIVAAVETYGDFTQGRKEEIYAWLAKQGEHANFRNKIQIGDKVTRNEDGVLVNLSQLNRVAKKEEKQGADKVEPKFKVEEGKWYVCVSQFCNCIEGRVYKATSDSRIIDDFGTEYDMHSDAYKYFRLWTIQDAKDGDVLTNKYEDVMLFKGITDDRHICGYCQYSAEDRKLYNECSDFSNYYPSTKEQRNLLFSKIKEAGYEWDAEKKELKKIEQKSADTDNKFIKMRETKPKDISEFLDRLTTVEQEFLWEHIAKIRELDKEEQKPTEWGEEDEWCLEQINFLIRNSYSADDKVERLSNWVKSLRDRCTWKPSDEQLDSLYDVLNPCDGFNREVLESLYVQLKKLREE